MYEHNPSLFRKEAIEHRADRLHGTVRIATPLSWQVISYTLLAVLVAVAIFLSSASYSRVETAQGVISLNKGVAAIVPSRAGVVGAVLVAEGDRVAADQRLAVIGAEESTINGKGAPEQIRDAIAVQDAQLADQTKLQLAASVADQRRLAAQIEGNLTAIASLEGQIQDQRELVELAEADFRDAQTIVARGFISKRDMEQRRGTILTRRQQLSQLQQELQGKRAEILQARRAIAQAAISARAQAAGMLSNRASLDQGRVQANLAQGYVLKSPMAGIVTGINVRAGQPVTTDQQLMMVVPVGSQPRVELYLPVAAIGFIKPEQEVRLSVDAYNYQTFGTIKARVVTVSQAAIVRQTQNGPVPSFLVSAVLERPTIKAFGQERPLLPGMTLSARITTEKRSLIQWLFEPFFAIRGR